MEDEVAGFESRPHPFMRLYSSDRWQRSKNKKTPGVSARRRGFSRISDDELYALIKEDILRIAAQPERPGDSLCAEWYANTHRVPIHRITQIFQRLNHERLMTQRKNHKNDHAWNASRYEVRRK